MTAKECRNVFNTMIAKLASLYPDPTDMPPDAREAMASTVEMYKLQALWEIAAQLAEANGDKSRIHTLDPGVRQ